LRVSFASKRGFDKKRQKRGDVFLKKIPSNKVSYDAVKRCKPLENFMVFEEEEEELPEETEE